MTHRWRGRIALGAIGLYFATLCASGYFPGIRSELFMGMAACAVAAIICGTRSQRILSAVLLLGAGAAVLALFMLDSTGMYPFRVLRAIKDKDGFHYTETMWWHEGYGGICYAVRGRTYRKVQLAIVLDDFRAKGMEYAFTGTDKGTAYALGPGGIDSWIVTGEEKWQGSPQRYFEEHQEVKTKPPSASTH